MRFHVIVCKDDRSWDSIREQTSQAFLRISQFMEPDPENEVKAVGMLLRNMIIKGCGLSRVLEFLQSEGYTVTIKEL